MASLYIVGAGGFGREVLAYAIDAHERGAPLAPAGFVDDRADAHERYLHPIDIRVVASPDSIAPEPGDRYVVAVGDPRVRRALAHRIARCGGRFASVIHPTAYIARTAAIGDDCVIGPFAFVGPGARVLDHVVLNTYASIGHDAVVGPHAVFSPYAVVNGAAVVDEGVFLGTHATAAVGVRIGAWSKLAAGAIATSDVASCSLAAGNPARAREMFERPAE